VVIGTPPGVHCTSDSAACTKGIFKYPIHRHSHSFLEALAFLLIKGINKCMPPLLTSTDILNSPGGCIALALRYVLWPFRVLIDIDSQVRALGQAQSELSPIVYSNIRNLHGIIASRHYPMSMSQVLTRAQPHGGLAACYLASHRYSLSNIDVIIHTYRHARTHEQFTMRFSRDGMPVDELNFYWNS
ncbi:hypothetical protein PAXRUDRAFT_176352, partial [Paxillus rubicundulus Ve08.2h10]